MAWVLKMDDATIESGLVHDFDASLSGIGQELGAGAYSMRLETGSTCRHAQLQQHLYPIYLPLLRFSSLLLFAACGNCLTNVI